MFFFGRVLPVPSSTVSILAKIIKEICFFSQNENANLRLLPFWSKKKIMRKIRLFFVWAWNERFALQSGVSSFSVLFRRFPFAGWIQVQVFSGDWRQIRIQTGEHWTVGRNDWWTPQKGAFIWWKVWASRLQWLLSTGWPTSDDKSFSFCVVPLHVSAELGYEPQNCPCSNPVRRERKLLTRHKCIHQPLRIEPPNCGGQYLVLESSSRPELT